jgi:hypothetical protein
MGYLLWSLWPNIKSLPSIIGIPYRGKRFWTHQIPTSCLPTLLIFIHIEYTFCICTFLVTLPTIWHTYMKLVTKYQIPVVNSCWEKCDEKCAYTNVCCYVNVTCWFLYTLNIYAHFSSHFSQQLLMAEIWYLVTSFI